MTKRDKRLAGMRRNPRQVRFAELKAVLDGLGFVGRPGRGDHWVFEHPLLAHPIVIDPRRPFVLAVYVKNALKAIDQVLEKQEADPDGD